MEDKADLKRDLAWARENITVWAVMQGIAQHIAIGSLVVAAVWGSNTVAVVLANHIEDGHSTERTPRDAFNRGWASATWLPRLGCLRKGVLRLEVMHTRAVVPVSAPRHYTQ